MAPTFPNEVLELIVDELAVSGKGPWAGLLRDVKSCSLVSMAFVPMCRKHLFHSLTLRPGKKSQAGKVFVTDTKEKWAELMLQYLNLKVHPGVYVRKLKYQADVGADGHAHNRVLMKALRRLPSLTELDLHVDHQRGGMDFWGCDISWRTSVLYLFQQPTLKSLTIHNLILPMETLLWSTGLETLDVRDSWSPGRIKPRRDPLGRGWSCLARPDRPEWKDGPEFRQIYPRALKVDSASGVDTGLLPGGLDGSPGVSNFERVQKLDLTVEGFRDYNISKLVFEHAESLLELKLEMKLEPNENTILPDFPLNYLHPASLKTLTHLELSITITRAREGMPMGDPYIGFTAKALPGLIVLKCLTLSIWIIDVVYHPETAFGEQWGRLDRTLVPHGLGICSLPALKDVQMEVWVKVWGPLESLQRSGGGIEDGEEFLQNLHARVYPLQFPGLLRLSKEGELDFSFKSAMKIAPYGSPGRARDTVQWWRR